jgi:hypothetical protein
MKPVSSLSPGRLDWQRCCRSTRFPGRQFRAANSIGRLMDLATFLRGTANFLVGVSIVRLVGADLKAEIRHDSASLREKANGLAQKSPYRAAALAAAAGLLTGIAVARSPRRTIPTRF